MKTLAQTAISVLDLAKVSNNETIAQTYAHSKDLAQLVERLGYTRFWLAEHHNIEGIASAATPLLIGYIAENTKTIRVGSGGIMLPNHAPLVVAEQFGTLESLYPGRIDLGLGRAPGTDQTTMRAVRRYHAAHEIDFSEMVKELLHFFKEPETHQKVRAVPGAGIDLPIYILGSSLYSAELSARMGLPYAFAGHFAPAMMVQAFQMYRSLFRPSKVLAQPYVMLGIPVIAAATDEEAEFISSSLKQAFLAMVRGKRKLSSPPVRDMDTVWSPQEKAAVESMLHMLVTGSPERVRRELDKVIAFTGVDELIITSDTYDKADRLKSFEYIAQAKSLRAETTASL